MNKHYIFWRSEIFIKHFSCRTFSPQKAPVNFSDSLKILVFKWITLFRMLHQLDKDAAMNYSN